MKQNILYILSGIFLLASCQQEELPGKESRYGYLSLKSVVAEVENVNAPASRALPAVDSKDLYVEVWEGEKKVLSYAPGESIPERIKLPEGIYTAKAYNEAYTTFKSLEDGALGDPVFYGESDEFSVAESEVPAEQTVLVYMHNSGISFRLDETFSDYFDTDVTQVEISCNDRTVTLDYPLFTGEDYVYFYMEGDTKAQYVLTSRNKDNEDVRMDGELSVENGKCYTLVFHFRPE